MMRAASENSVAREERTRKSTEVPSGRNEKGRARLSLKVRTFQLIIVQEKYSLNPSPERKGKILEEEKNRFVRTTSE